MTILEEMWEGTDLSEAELVERISNSRSPDELTDNLCLLVTKQPLTQRVPMLGGGAATRFIRSKSLNHRGVLESLPGNEAISHYALELYEANHGLTRDTLNEIHLFPRQHRVPHLDLLIASYLKNTGETPTILNGSLYKSAVALILGSGELLSWCREIVADGKVPLKHYGGQTYTIFGFYSNDFDWRTGIIDAEHYIDLGGGFGTPDIDGMTGKEFTSYDLESPTLAEKINLPFKSITQFHWLPDHVQKNAYKRLRYVPHVPFDVYKDDFPEGNSHCIVSTGFLSSTVGSLSEYAKNGASSNVLAETCWQAVNRVARLVFSGSDVQLIAIGRPQWRTYKYRTLHIRFKNQRAHLIEAMKKSHHWSERETLYERG